MALLDGTYEVTSQQAIGGVQTQFEATAPDGTPVRIVWFELPPQQEARFELYRRTLKQLKRSGLAALHDVVSRPGAHYVAWERPPGRRVDPDETLEEALSEAGYPLEVADVRSDGGHLRIYDLAFDGQPTLGDTDDVPDRDERPDRTLPPWLASWSLSAALLLAAALALAAGFDLRTNDAIVVVPDLRGRSLEQAVEALEGLGLGLSASPAASEAPANTVLKTDPPAGTQLRPGRLIRLTFALPPDRIAPTEVPRLVGLEFPDEVELRLREAGLALGTVARIPAETAAGIVLSQRTPAGERVGRDQTVDILVSDGPEPAATFLPDLVGLALEDAQALARTAGLRPESVIVELVPAAPELAGRVLSQSLPPRLPIPLETSVLRLVVAEAGTVASSEGAIPNLIGLSESQAREVARSLPFTIEFVAVPDLPEGIVDQDPAPGTPGGGALALRINVRPVEIPAPDVRAQILTPETRALPYRFFIEPGIPEQLAEIMALPLDGEPVLVVRTEVEGGDQLQGEWRSPVPGPITFRLLLNGAFYAEQRVNP